MSPRLLPRRSSNLACPRYLLLAIEAIPSQAPDQSELEHERRRELFSERMFARVPADLAEDLPDRRRREIAEAGLEFFTHRPESVVIDAQPAATGTAVVQTLMPDRPFIVDSILE